MDQAEKKRKLLLAGALIATLIAVIMVEDDEEDVVVDSAQPVQPTKSTSGKERVNISTIDYLPVDQLGQREFSAEAGDIFKSTSWIPTRPRISMQQAAEAKKLALERVAPPPAPTAPALPFIYIGKAIDGNNIQVFLAEADEYHVVRLGGRIDDQYRVDAMDDETVTLTYLPLNTRQVLTINEEEAGNF